MAKRQFKLLLAGVIVATLTWLVIIFGTGFISGTSNYWETPRYDTSAHLNGWLFYKADTWRIPIFHTDRMNSPDGASIVFSDSIPLVALPAKVIAQFAGGNWHYFGLFIAFSYILNAISLLWLLRLLGVSNYIGSGFAVIFACFTTLFNIQFESFFAHFLIITSLGLYLQSMRHPSRRNIGLFIALVGASALIHPYLFLVCAGLFVTTIVSLRYNKSISWKQAGLWLILFLLAISSLLIIAGYASYKPTGFQEHLYATSPAYALDLTAPFIRLYNPDDISLYFGSGFFVLLVLGSILLWPRRMKLAKKHLPLLVFCILLLGLAVSSSLYIGGRAIFHLPLPSSVDELLEIIRSSKRLVVPLYYLVAVVCFVVALKRRSLPITLLVVLALVAQIADNAFYVRSLHRAALASQETILNTNEWQAILRGSTKLNVFPSYGCLFDYRTTAIGPVQWSASLELYQAAARAGVISNSMRLAKRTKDCAAEQTLGKSIPQPRVVSVYLRDDSGRFIVEPSPACLQKQRDFASFGMYCRF